MSYPVNHKPWRSWRLGERKWENPAKRGVAKTQNPVHPVIVSKEEYGTEFKSHTIKQGPACRSQFRQKRLL